jgi:aspartyl-tRNA(Asn)/glutamyl-tRNA(Gln) amidotransferase subunit B
VAQIRAGMPELPKARRARYVAVLGLSAYDSGVLTADLALADYFEAVVAAGIGPKTAANWVTGEFSRLLKQRAAAGLRASAVALKPAGLAELISGVDGGKVSAANAKAVLAEVFESGESPQAVVDRRGLQQVGDAASIGAEVEAVMAEFATQVADYRAGKVALFGFLVGQVMKRTAGRADARLVNEELRRRLDG